MQVEEWKGGNQNQKRDKDAEYGGMSEPVWPCLYVHSFFLGSFQVAAGPSQRCFFPINRAPHLFLSFQPHFKVPKGAVKLEPAQVYKCKILQ